MDSGLWMLDPRVRQAVHADDVCRQLVDALHDAMSARTVTAADLARYLGVPEEDVHRSMADPLSLSLNDLVRMLDPLGITLAPAARS